MNERLETDVLVVGAGPTGLTVAHELARAGIRCHLIDKDSGPSVHSKALAVQARSLELFRWMQLDRQFLDQGYRAPGIRINVEGKYVAKGELSGLLDAGTRANFILVISQADTEKILVAGLARHGGSVQWETECLRFVRTGADPYPVVALCRRADATTYEVAARYIVGCDGAHSMVRHAMPVEFAGDVYQQRFVLADAKLTWRHSYDFLNLFLGRTGVCIFFPFREPQFGRLILMDGKEAPDRDPGPDQIRSAVEEYTGDPVQLTQVEWISRFRLHHRVATSYSDGPVFIAGDAAHIHSPAGGQGMNTGIQDAFNLAWKLAFAVRGLGTNLLLESYHAERHPVGLHLLKRTDRLFSLASTGNRAVGFVRNMLVRLAAPVVLRREKPRAAIFNFVSQLGIRYRRSPIVLDATERAPSGFRKALPPGNRLPDMALESADGPFYLHDVLTGTGYVLIWHHPPDEDLLLRIIDTRLTYLSDVLTHVVITDSSFSARGDITVLKERSGSASRFLGGTGPSLFLIRPDGHVAVRVWGQDIKTIFKYFERVHGIIN